VPNELGGTVMETNSRNREHRDRGPSLHRDAPTEIPLRQRLALSALVTGLCLWIRVAELIDARRD
jgi:hypothetical protein